MDLAASSRRLSSSSQAEANMSEIPVAIATPASVLFTPHRSPKGPRPAPSTFHTHGALEPSRVPLPVDVEDAIFFPTSGEPLVYPNDDLNYSEDVYETNYEPKNVPEGLTTSLFSATSTSPPPFALTSIPSPSASRIHPSASFSANEHTNAFGASPDPWVAQATFTPADLLIATSSNSISFTPNERPSTIGARNTSSQYLRNAFSTVHGSDLTSPSLERDGDLVSRPRDAQNLSNSIILDSEPPIQQARAVQTVENALQNLTLGAEGNKVDSKPSNLPVIAVPAPTPASANSSNRTAPIPIASLTVSSSNSKSPALVPGSYGTTSMYESTTWEKVEPIHDEWTELSNPSQDVVVISEDEDSDDDDDEEWEASRKVPGVVESGFLPTHEKKRRAAAAQAAKYTQKGLAPQSSGADTPRGKRTPTSSFAQNGGKGCAYEALSYPRPNATNATATSPSAKLTPQQEQIVAELQRARNSKGVVSPIPVPVAAYAHRNPVRLSSDW